MGQFQQLLLGQRSGITSAQAFCCYRGEGMLLLGGESILLRPPGVTNPPRACLPSYTEGFDVSVSSIPPPRPLLFHSSTEKMNHDSDRSPFLKMHISLFFFFSPPF